jgi:hypothetical protein
MRGERVAEDDQVQPAAHDPVADGEPQAADGVAGADRHRPRAGRQERLDVERPQVVQHDDGVGGAHGPVHVDVEVGHAAHEAVGQGRPRDRQRDERDDHE